MAEDFTAIFRFQIPLPPSANRYWRKFRNRMVVSQEAVDYKRIVAEIAIKEGVLPVPGDTILSLEIYFINVKSDLDNRIKITLDALNGIAYLDDNDIFELHVYKHFVPKKKRGQPREGYVIVSIGQGFHAHEI